MLQVLFDTLYTNLLHFWIYLTLGERWFISVVRYIGVASSLMGFVFPLDYLIESCVLKIVQKDAVSRGANFPDKPKAHENFL